MSSPPTSVSGGDSPFAASSGSGPARSTKVAEPSRKGARARQRAETRERIFETALREFREIGFGAAQVDRIAKAAGVARGTFYFHFPTKDDVLLELARRINARVARRVSVFGESSTSLQEFLLRVNDAIMDEHSRVGEAGLLSEMLSLYIRRPHDVQDPTNNVPTLSVELTRHLRVAADRGELHSALSPEQIAIVLLSSLFGIYTRIPQGAELRSACESLIELLVKGLRASD